MRKLSLALKMSMKGMSIEAITDVLEVQSASVKRWLARAAEQCDKVNDTMIKNVEVPKVEMDELWVIIQKKIFPRMKDYEDDGPWMWVAFAPGCRLILDFVIGPRKQYVSDKLVELTIKHLSNFCRGHGGLRYKDERGIECKNTPAREAGITDSKWTFNELMRFRCFKTPVE